MAHGAHAPIYCPGRTKVPQALTHIHTHACVNRKRSILNSTVINTHPRLLYYVHACIYIYYIYMRACACARACAYVYMHMKTEEIFCLYAAYEKEDGTFTISMLFLGLFYFIVNFKT
jgi:hypothetical protein